MTTPNVDQSILQAVEAGLPRGDAGPLFPEAWHARAFALIVALVENKQVEWRTFQDRLVSELKEHEPASDTSSGYEIDQCYFESWLEAAEKTLISQGFIESEQIQTQEECIRASVARVRGAQTFALSGHK